MEDYKIDTRRREFKKGTFSSTARSTEFYAAKLRKTKRDTLFKQKRAVPGPIIFKPAKVLVDFNNIFASPSASFKSKLSIILSALESPIDDEELLQQFAIFIRTELSRPEENTALAMKLGLGPKLAALLECPSEKIQFEVAWTISNISLGLNEYCDLLIDLGVHEKLVAMATGVKSKTQEHVMLALANIAGDSVKARDAILKCGVVSTIAKVVFNKSLPVETLRACAMALTNLCRGTPSPPIEILKESLEIAKNMLSQEEDEEVVTNALWALSCVTDSAGIKADNKTIIERAVKYVGNKKACIKVPAIRILGNICAGPQESVDRIIEAEGLNALALELGTEEKGTILTELCWAISNIALGPSSHIAQLLKNGVVHRLAEIILTCSDHKARKEGAIALANACGEATEYQICKIVEARGLEALAYTLGDKDVDLIEQVLDGVDNILTVGEGGEDDENKMLIEFDSFGGQQALEELVLHPNEKIFKKARIIMEKHYAVDEAEEILKFRELYDKVEHKLN